MLKWGFSCYDNTRVSCGMAAAGLCVECPAVRWATVSLLVCLSLPSCLPPLSPCPCVCPFALPNCPPGTIKIELWSVSDWSAVRCRGNAISLYENLSTFAAVYLPARPSVLLLESVNQSRRPTPRPMTPSSGCRRAGFPISPLMSSHLCCLPVCLPTSPVTSPACQSLL